MSREYHTIAYAKNIAIVKKDQKCGLINMDTNQIVGSFDNFFSFEIQNNRLIYQYKVNKVRVFDIKDNKIIFEDADIIYPHAIYRTNDGFYHVINYFEAFDTLNHLVFLNVEEINNGYYVIKTESGYGIYHIIKGIIIQPIYDKITFKNDLIVIRRDNKDTILALTKEGIRPELSKAKSFDHIGIDNNYKIIYALVNQIVHCFKVDDNGNLKSIFFTFDFDDCNTIYDYNLDTFNIEANSLSNFTIMGINYNLVNNSLQINEEMVDSKIKKPKSICNF